jgi:hypothetical protein
LYGSGVGVFRHRGGGLAAPVGEDSFSVAAHGRAGFAEGKIAGETGNAIEKCTPMIGC